MILITDGDYSDYRWLFATNESEEKVRAVIAAYGAVFSAWRNVDKPDWTKFPDLRAFLSERLAATDVTELHVSQVIEDAKGASDPA